ncbi:MAG: mannitol dehydrogenase family protein [Clostridia bacterium]|nr:mannitol dehydrogenase family protein [Clostridia bacterium]
MEGYIKACYNREEMIEKTRNAPEWVHFGYGNIFRAFPARGLQKLLNEGFTNKGVIAVEGYDGEIVDFSKKSDDKTIVVTFMGDGSVEKEVVESVAESLTFTDWGRLCEIFKSDSLKMVTFTITEKGYTVSDNTDSYMGTVTRLLYERYKNGNNPVAMVSMDNCSKNGDKLKEAVVHFAEKMEDEGFLEYVEKVTFPLTMIDKITPRPSDSVKRMLEEDGWSNMDIAVTSKSTYIAPFVNGEECEYLVIEDKFPKGRVPLEKCGVIFTSRDEVERAERLKVTAALNPLHTALAVLGCTLGYKKISDEMKNEDLVKLIEGIAEEGLKVVEKPKVLSAEDFVNDVLTKRLPNPSLPDTPQRIATDTSQKVKIRFGETIKAYGDEAHALKFVPFAIAGWLRYLDAVYEDKTPMELSPDPMLEEIIHLEKIELLRRSDIFGVDLYEAGLSGKILEIYNGMRISVKETLKKYMEAYR